MKNIGPHSATFTSSLYAELRHDLLAGAWPPGARLPIKDICARNQVSLSPVREALSRLAAEGFLVQTDRRGFRVAGISKEDLSDLTRVRCEINDLALRDAIEHGSEMWAECIVLAFHRLSRVPRFDAESTPRLNPDWDLHHRAFHSSLVAGSVSSRLRDYCDRLFDQTERYRGLAAVLNLKETKMRAATEHKEIMDATLDRNAELATTLMRSHLERTSQKLLENWDLLESRYGISEAPRSQLFPSAVEIRSGRGTSLHPSADSDRR